MRFMLSFTGLGHHTRQMGAVALVGALSQAAVWGQAAAPTPTSASTPPTLIETIGKTVNAWQDYLAGLPVPWIVTAVLGFLVAYAFGWILFMALFGTGKFAPVAARWGLGLTTLLYFIFWLGLFLPAYFKYEAPGWVWLVGFLLLLGLLLFVVPKARRPERA